MRSHNKLACSALAIDLICGIVGLIYLITLGVKGSETAVMSVPAFETAVSMLLILAAIMVISTLVMILALPKKR